MSCSILLEYRLRPTTISPQHSGATSDSAVSYKTLLVVPTNPKSAPPACTVPYRTLPKNGLGSLSCQPQYNTSYPALPSAPHIYSPSSSAGPESFHHCHKHLSKYFTTSLALFPSNEPNPKSRHQPNHLPLESAPRIRASRTRMAR